METTPAKKNRVQPTERFKLNLSSLEEKVAKLIEHAKTLKEENAQLKKENRDLEDQLKAVEGSLVSETKDLEELSQEKVMTKMVVDELIDSIDELVQKPK